MNAIHRAPSSTVASRLAGARGGEHRGRSFERDVTGPAQQVVRSALRLQQAIAPGGSPAISASAPTRNDRMRVSGPMCTREAIRPQPIRPIRITR